MKYILYAVNSPDTPTEDFLRIVLISYTKTRSRLRNFLLSIYFIVYSNNLEPGALNNKIKDSGNIFFETA